MEKILWVKILNPMEFSGRKFGEEIWVEEEENKMKLTHLPEEILIEIFKSLSVEDLISISLVCSRFNEIISSEKEIMKKFVIFLNHKTVKLKWNGLRNYSRMKISLVKSHSFMYGYRKL